TRILPRGSRRLDATKLRNGAAGQGLHHEDAAARSRGRPRRDGRDDVGSARGREATRTAAWDECARQVGGCARPCAGGAEGGGGRGVRTFLTSERTGTLREMATIETRESAALTLTERAAGKVKALMAQEPAGEAEVLRVAIRGGGCGGFEYALGFDRGAAEG